MIDVAPALRGSFWTFNLGHLLILIPMAGTCVWLIWAASAVVSDHGARLIGIEKDLTSWRVEQKHVTESVAQIKSDVAYLRGRSERTEQAPRYAPPFNVVEPGGRN